MGATPRPKEPIVGIQFPRQLIQALDKLAEALSQRRGTRVMRNALIREILTAGVRNPQAVGLDAKAA